MSTSDKEQSGEGEAECLDHGVPSQWPLFDAPVLSSVRVTGFTENGGTVVSVCVCVSGWGKSGREGGFMPSFLSCSYS